MKPILMIICVLVLFSACASSQERNAAKEVRFADKAEEKTDKTKFTIMVQLLNRKRFDLATKMVENGCDINGIFNGNNSLKLVIINDDTLSAYFLLERGITITPAPLAEAACVGGPCRQLQNLTYAFG